MISRSKSGLEINGDRLPLIIAKCALYTPPHGSQSASLHMLLRCPESLLEVETCSFFPVFHIGIAFLKSHIDSC